MHRDLLKALPVAKGEAKHVVVLFLDIRGFTSFPGFAESIQSAMYLKKMYVAIIKKFFPDHSFFKLTGDGMMVVYCHEEGDLAKIATKVVGSSLKLVTAFPTLLRGDAMITFDVPTHLGIGIARGAATQLLSGSLVLDFSGRPLNVAARLMDLARPQGVVLEGSFTKDVIGAANFRKLSPAKAYIRGIAENSPLDILLVKNWTNLRDEAKRPIGRYVWHRQTYPLKLKQLSERGPRFGYVLQKPPAFTDEIKVIARTKNVLASGRTSRNTTSTFPVEHYYEDDSGIDKIRLDLEKTARVLALGGIKDTWDVTIEISYRYVPE
jgi:class 3 adenylate cyclase